MNKALKMVQNTIKCYVQGVCQVEGQISGNKVEQVIQEIVLISVVQTIGYSLSNEGRSALEQITNPLKQQLQIRSNLFNNYFDVGTQKISELRQTKIDNEFVINPDLLRISQLSQVYLQGGQSVVLEGPQGLQKSTILKYLLKNHQTDLSSKVIKIPITCFQQPRTMRTLLNQKLQQQLNKKPILIVIEDLHIQDTLNINILQFLLNVKQNNNKLIVPDQSQLIPLNYNFNILSTYRTDSEKKRTLDQSKYQLNRIAMGNESEDFKEFFKIFILEKLNVQPQQQHQIQKVLIKVFAWLRENKSKVNCSSMINLSNLHLVNNLICNINSNMFKDSQILETLVMEIKQVIAARIIYPDMRKQLLEHCQQVIKEECSSLGFAYDIQTLDNLSLNSNQGASGKGVMNSNGQGLKNFSPYIQTILNNLQGSLMNLSKVSGQRSGNAIRNISSGTKKHHMFIAYPGSQIKEGIFTICERNNIHVYIPSCKKFRDSSIFIEEVNKSIERSVRNQQKLLILVDDIEHNDLSYIDYIVHLIQAIEEVSSISHNNSLSYFNALSILVNRNTSTLRDMLLQLAKDQNLINSSQQTNPASPSSLAVAPSSGSHISPVQLTDAQILKNFLHKVSQQVTFVILVQNLQNYHQYVSTYSQLETEFNICFVSSIVQDTKQEDQRIIEKTGKMNTEDQLMGENQSKQILSEIQQWVTEYTLSTTYTSQFNQLLQQSHHQFNQQLNNFFVGENKESQIFTDSNFETLQYHKISSELNLNIPLQYCQSEQRFTLFINLYSTIKNLIQKSLSQQKSLYQKYHEHYEELNQSYMNKLLGGKDLNSQVTKQHVHAFNLLQTTEKIEQLLQLIRNKELLLKQKEKERTDLTHIFEKLRQEQVASNKECDTKILQILSKLKSVNTNEFKNLHNQINQNQMNELELELVTLINYLIFNKVKGVTFLAIQPIELVAKLSKLATTTLSHQQEQIISKYLKSGGKKNHQESIEKPLLTLLNKIIIEFSKKLSLNKAQNQSGTKLKQTKEQLSYLNSLIQVTSKQVQVYKDELEDQQLKEKSMRHDMKDILKKIDMKELKHLRNDYKLKSLLKQGKKSEQKLDKIKIRMKNLEGDCFIIACSVLFLGPFSVSERMEFRKQLAEKLLTSKNIESSEYWQNIQSEQLHSKYFKKIIKNDLGLNQKLFNKLNHLFIDSLFAEYIFTLMFAPSIVVTYDSVGNYQQYLSEEVLEEIKSYRVKVLFSSDYFIEEKLSSSLEQLALKGQQQQVNQLIFLNDVNDFSKQIQGKCQDSSILNRLTQRASMYRIENVFYENSILTLPAIILFSTNQLFNLNQGFLAASTIYNATFVNKNEAWIEIKQILLKHFLLDNYQKLQMIKQQIETLRDKLLTKQKGFDQLFFKVKAQSIEEKDHKMLEEIRVQFLEMKQLDEDYAQYNQAFHNLINEHPLLASYSNIFVILYYSLKELSRFTEEITYSWKIYTKVIDMIIGKIIRDLTMNLKNKENQEESDGEEDKQNNDNKDKLGGGGGKKKKKDKEFTIDEEFFHSVIMPSIYSTIISGVKQDHVSLFNLLFALEIALKKTTVTQDDKDFFVKRFFRIKNCSDWRLNPHKPSTIPTGFADHSQRIKLQEFMNLKRDALKIYPDMRKFFETVEIKIGKEFTYREANNLIYQKLFKPSGTGENGVWKDLALIKKINLGFLCPDDEWRSKICQFVYEELSTIFDFNEDLNKLHNFIKTASWSLPVALFTSNSINIVNTVCSIASYYGVGLEVLRTDYQQSIKKHEQYYANKEINDNMKQVYGLPSIDKPLSNEAACTHYEEIDPLVEDRILIQKQNYQKMFMKDELEIDDKQITQNQSSIQLIEKCAENGTWVLISTLKFPSFWYKISRKLEKLHKKGKVLNTFRLFFDLQGYSLQEIPESFLFNHCVKFYLTEKNNEDMEGFNDVWANILNDDLLNAKDLHNVPVLEPHSFLQHVNLNLQSNLYESSIESMRPSVIASVSNVKEVMNPTQNNQLQKNSKLVKEDKITYSMSQYESKDTIILPQIFTQEHLQEILQGGEDLKSPKNKTGSKLKVNHQHKRSQFGEGISEISQESIYNMRVEFMSNTQSLLMEDMTRGEGAFLSELNQVFTRKMDTNKKGEGLNNEVEAPRYEMVKRQVPTQHTKKPTQQKN